MVQIHFKHRTILALVCLFVTSSNSQVSGPYSQEGYMTQLPNGTFIFGGETTGYVSYKKPAEVYGSGKTATASYAAPKYAATTSQSSQSVPVTASTSQYSQSVPVTASTSQYSQSVPVTASTSQYSQGVPLASGNSAVYGMMSTENSVEAAQPSALTVEEAYGVGSEDVVGPMMDEGLIDCFDWPDAENCRRLRHVDGQQSAVSMSSADKEALSKVGENKVQILDLGVPKDERGNLRGSTFLRFLW